MTTLVKPDARRLRVLQVGCGAFGAVHGRAWLQLGFGDRLVIAELQASARDRASAAFPQARIVEDWRTVLDEADVVDIVTPGDAHLAIALAALGAGRDVLIEKPMAMSRADAARIAAYAHEHRRIVQVGYVLRLYPAARRLCEIVRDGGIGTPVWVAGDFMSLKPPRRDAGVVLNDAVHLLDLVLWAIGRLPDAVSAMLLDRLGRGVEDIAAITLSWQNGPIGRIDASCIVAGEHPDPYVPGGHSRKRLTIGGDAGQVTADFMTDSLTWQRCRQQRTADGWWSPASEPPETMSYPAMTPQEAVAAELASFVDCVTARRQPEADVHTGVAMAALCDAIFEAARRGCAITLAA